MRAAALAVLLACGGARAAWFHGDSPGAEATRQLFENKRYDQLIADLTADGRLERLRGADLRSAYLYLGLAYEKIGRADRAVGVYQLGVSLFPKDVNLLTQLAQTLHDGGLEEQAEPIFQRILKIHPNNAAAHLGLGEIDLKLGFYDRGADHFEKALKQLGDNGEVWREYGELFLASNRPQQAEPALLRSISLKDTVDARADLAAAQRAEGHLDEALKTLTAAVTAHPERLDVLSARSLWLLEAGREDEALADAEKLLAGSEPPPLAYWVRARVRLRRDQYGAAVEDLKALTLQERLAPFAAAAARQLLKQLGAR